MHLKDHLVGGTGFRAVTGRFLGDTCGATAVEYAIVAGGIAVAIAIVVGEVGTGVNGLFTEVKSGF